MLIRIDTLHMTTAEAAMPCINLGIIYNIYLIASFEWFSSYDIAVNNAEFLEVYDAIF